MMKSNRGNRLSNVWTCPRCGRNIDARTFKLSTTDASKLICPNEHCATAFAWKQQNKGKLWPEQRAYNVLR